MQATYCPHCMNFVQSEICPYCGSDVSYPGNPMHLPVGMVLNGRQPYLIGACRGQGGFGVTYIALDPVTNTRVAVKEYFPTYCSGRNGSANIMSYYGQEESYNKGKERFLEEAKMLQSLTDLPSVVDVMDYFETNNTAYLVMEFLDGCSLKDYVQNNGPMPVNQLLMQMKPLLRDLEQMHQRGVIHRDIAPDNIILLPDGRMKLIDFGAARSYLGEKSMSVVVKKGFAPAEQYMRKGLTACADVYALAATIYYCITGKVPADSADRQYGSDGIDAPSALGVAITTQQEKALEHALELQPKLRTQSIAQFMEELFEEPRGETMPEPESPEMQIIPEPVAVPEVPKPVEQVIAKEESVTKPAAKHEPEFVQTIPMETYYDSGSDPVNRNYTEITAKNSSDRGNSKKILSKWHIACVAAIILLGAFFCFVHVWTDATCLVPAKCSICGATRGSSLDHEWPLNSTKMLDHCSRCGIANGSIVNLDSSMLNSTSMEPDTEFYYGDKQVNLGGSIQVLDNEIENCTSLTFCLEIYEVKAGNVYGEWGLWLRDLDGNWNLEAIIMLEHDFQRVIITFDEPVSFDAWCCPCLVLGDYWDFSLAGWMEDADVFVYDKYLAPSSNIDGEENLPILMSDDINTKNANGSWPVLGSQFIREQVKSITFLDTVQNAPSSAWDVSERKNGSVLAWVESAGDLFDLYIAGNGGVIAPMNCRKLFEGYRNLEAIEFNKCFDTSIVTDMSYMFYGCTDLTKMDVSCFNTDRVTNTCGMFMGCTALKKLDVSGFNTSNVTDMSYMFQLCSKWLIVDVTGFDVSKVQNYYCFMNGDRKINGQPWEEFFVK